MAKTILGYEVASPEQQRRTALAILGFVGAIAIAGVSVLFLIAHWEQSGRQQTLATIITFETKCRYVVRNLSKRVSYYDHTGYIGCAEAQSVADANNNALGSVQQRTLATVDFNTTEGRRISTEVALHGDVPISAGQQVEILYRTDNPTDVIEFNKTPMFGKDSLLATAKTAQKTVPLQTPTVNPKQITPKRRPSDSVSDTTKFWIGLGAVLLMTLAAIWLIRCMFRAIKWLFSPNQSNVSDYSGNAQPPHAKISAVSRPTPGGSFGQRRVY